MAGAHEEALREDTLDPILIDNRGAWRVMTLNRPDRLNAFNDAMHRRLAAALGRAPRRRRLPRRAVDRRRPRLLRRAGSQRSIRHATSATRIETFYNPLVRRHRAASTSRWSAPSTAPRPAPAPTSRWPATSCWRRARRNSSRRSPRSAWSRTPAAPGSCRGWSARRAPGRWPCWPNRSCAETAESWGLIWRAVDDDKLRAEAEALTAISPASRPRASP